MNCLALDLVTCMVTLIAIIGLAISLNTIYLMYKKLKVFGNGSDINCQHLRGHSAAAIVATALFAFYRPMLDSYQQVLSFISSELSSFWNIWYVGLGILVIGVMLHMNIETRKGYIFR